MSSLAIARQLVRAADERSKPNADRLREYTDAGLARLKPALEAATPVYPAFEQVRLSFSLERMREYLGPDHPDRQGGPRREVAGRQGTGAR